MDIHAASSKSAATYPEAVFSTPLGSLYNIDCLDFMKSQESNKYDLIFADPPFNLDKKYPSGIDDALKEREYILWCKKWLIECERLLKDGGSIFVMNLPKWNTYISNILNENLIFRNWICCSMKYSLPIKGRLYPAHYSLLYYTKHHASKTFDPDRLPMEVCPHCHGDLRDYGGYKNKMNPSGITLSDVWTDLSPVRHKKYKKRKDANELPVKLLDRVIEMASKENDLVFDPFGGAGTTYVVAEMKGRRWEGTEIGPCDVIVDRFRALENEREDLDKLRKRYNKLFPDQTMRARLKKNLWTDRKFEQESNGSQESNFLKRRSVFEGDDGDLKVSTQNPTEKEPSGWREPDASRIYEIHIFDTTAEAEWFDLGLSTANAGDVSSRVSVIEGRGVVLVEFLEPFEDKKGGWFDHRQTPDE